jgi:glycine/D-amino acid oxidase-like deaminating enzyme
VDAVVIGAGALVTATAHHLATHRKRVALVERFAAASQTSPRAAGLTQQLRRSEVSPASRRRVAGSRHRW